MYTKRKESLGSHIHVQYYYVNINMQLFLVWSFQIPTILMLSTFMKVPMLYLLPFPQKLFEDTSIPANPCKYETIYIYDNLGRDI